MDNFVDNISADERRKMDELKEKMMGTSGINFQKDDYFLTKYLRCCNWDVESALKRIISTYKLRKAHPTWFATKKASEYKTLLNYNSRYMLENRDKNGRRIFLYKFFMRQAILNFYIKVYTVENSLTHGLKFRTFETNRYISTFHGNFHPHLGNTHESLTPQMCSELDDLWFECLLAEPETQVNGLSIIIDCTSTPMCMLKWLKPSIIKIGTEKADLLAVQKMDIHIVNTSTLFDTCLALVKPFLSKKIKQQIHLHGNDWSSLHYYLGRDRVPEEYGGPAGKIVDYEKCYKYLYDRENFIYDTRQYGIISSP